MARGGHVKADREVRLADVAMRATARGAVCAGSCGDAARGPARRHRAEPALDAAPHARRIDVAGDDERQVVGDVVAAEELDELALAEPLHAVGACRSPAGDTDARRTRSRTGSARPTRAGSSAPCRISSRITSRSRASSSRIDARRDQRVADRVDRGVDVIAAEHRVIDGVVERRSTR